ncbi:MAG: YceI family protein [Bacteroidia bacterium]
MATNNTITNKEKETGTLEKISWKLDPDHSEVAFQVKHMMISNVRGYLKDFSVEVTSDDENFSNAEIFFSGKMDSISTSNEKRDQHLRSEEFFDIENNPEITFRSAQYTQTEEGKYKLEGDLTIKGTTQKVILDVDFGGIQTDPWGNEKAGFSVTGKINRKDFGLNWNTALEKGGMLVGDDVKISCEIQLIKDK